MTGSFILRFWTIFAATILMSDSLGRGAAHNLTCGTTTYNPATSTCFGGDFLCPIYGDTVYTRCGDNCYSEVVYSCDHGTLKLRNDSIVEELSGCGEAYFHPAQYVCYDDEFLCPIIEDTPYLRCSNDCYNFREYSCSNGALESRYQGCTRELERYIRFGRFYPCCDGLTYFSGKCIRFYYNSTSSPVTLATSTLSASLAGPTCVGVNSFATQESRCCEGLIRVGATCRNTTQSWDVVVSGISPSTTSIYHLTNAFTLPETTTRAQSLESSVRATAYQTMPATPSSQLEPTSLAEPTASARPSTSPTGFENPAVVAPPVVTSHTATSKAEAKSSALPTTTSFARSIEKAPSASAPAALSPAPAVETSASSPPAASAGPLTLPSSSSRPLARMRFVRQ